MTDWSENIDYPDMPKEFEAVQQTLDQLVAINYDTALQAGAGAELTREYYRARIIDIIRNNPPLATIPEYFSDKREEYLWYSDFYDSITKEVYHHYRTFVAPDAEITGSNYAEELAKIDLPYFRELVDLIVLEKLSKEVSESTPKIEQAVEKPPTKTTSKRLTAKRSLDPKLTSKQYALLAECVETIKLFRRPVPAQLLKKLLAGKSPEPLQVTNQKSLVYLFDELMKGGYIKDTWISVATGNRDFVSFRSTGNEERYGSEPHYITAQQLSNSRARNEREYIHGLETIDEMVELMTDDE